MTESESKDIIALYENTIVQLNDFIRKLEVEGVGPSHESKCTKCGFEKFNGPRFKHRRASGLLEAEEWLFYTCGACGYETKELPLDHPGRIAAADEKRGK